MSPFEFVKVAFLFMTRKKIKINKIDNVEQTKTQAKLLKTNSTRKKQKSLKLSLIHNRINTK